MKIALIGASGNVGSRILKELSQRGHHITAIARDTSKVAKVAGVTAVAVDIADKVKLSDVLRGHDAVISSVHFTASDPDRLIEAVETAGVRRYLVVGGAGSLEVAPGSCWSTPPISRRSIATKLWGASPSSTSCGATTRWNGPFSRLRRCSCRVSAQASSGSERTNC